MMASSLPIWLLNVHEVTTHLLSLRSAKLLPIICINHISLTLE